MLPVIKDLGVLGRTLLATASNGSMRGVGTKLGTVRFVIRRPHARVSACLRRVQSLHPTSELAGAFKAYSSRIGKSARDG